MDDEGRLFESLILRVRQGDEAAAGELVRQFEPEVRREVRMRLRLRDSRLRRVFDSMDVVQSVLQSFFVRAAAGQYDLDAPDQLRALLATMARIKLAEQVRRQQQGRRDVRKTSGGFGEDPADNREDPARVAAGRDLLHEVRTRLSLEERRIMDLRSEGQSWAEVAAEVGGSPEARRKQFSRAVDRVVVELGLEHPASTG